MTSFKDPAKRREIIMSHYNNPSYKKDAVENSIDVFSKVCVDELHLQLDWDGEKLKDAKFAGQGCAIFISSVDIMISKIIGLNKDKIRKIVYNYELMINQKQNYDLSLLGELGVFENVSSHLNRLHCAEIIAIALKQI